MPTLLALELLLQELPDLSEGVAKSPGFYAGILVTLWVFERVFAYVYKPNQVTEAGVAKAVAQELTATELEALRTELRSVIDAELGNAKSQLGLLYDWHDREDPDRPGWKIWWVSSRDFKKLIELSERQSQLHRDLLAALERRAELDRILLSTLETVSRASANAATEASAARTAVGEVLAHLKGRTA